jgi:Ca2+-binding RTX toxin-like protein
MANLINDAIIGGNGNDVLTGDEGNDLIKGLAGNDTLSGLDGKDTIYGGDDNDLILGGNDVDSLYGNAGDDVVVGNKGNDRMIGNAGDDILGWADGDGSDRMSGNAGYDTVAVTGSVEKGDDFVLAQDGNKAIFDRVNLGKFTLTVDSAEKFDVAGLGGNDKFTVGDLSNTDVKLVEFSGGAGKDTLDASDSSTKIKAFGDGGNDELIGSSANDTLYGNKGNDNIEGEKGNDRMIGGAGNDTLGWDDGDGSDRMSGNAGYDTIEVDGSVEKGDDFVLAQDGNKAIFDRVNLGKFTLTVDSAEKFDVEGLGGDDKFTVKDLSNTDVKLVKFSGGAGNDWLNGKGTDTPIKAYGDAGNDTLKGGEGNDTLVGGAGNDLLVGNGGNDVLIGGNSPDTFGFSLKSNGVSTIKNFVSGSDQIKIDLAGGLDVNEYAVVDNNAAAAISNALVTYSVGTGDLFYNQNGSQAGYGDGGQFATLEGTNTLAYTDFTVS